MKETLKEKVKRTEHWMELADKLLRGKVIERAIWQYWNSDEEDRKEFDDYSTGIVLHLKDSKTGNASYCYVSQDDEQNGPGALVITYDDDSKPKNMQQETLPVGVEDIEEHQFNVETLKNK